MSIHSHPRVNYSKLVNNQAIYLPAISSFYSGYVSKQQSNPNHVEPGRIPAGFEHGVEGLNFLNEDQGYFTYKYGLYSAGHAQLDVARAQTEDSMVMNRDRKNTLILGDSGGYQIMTGVLKFDWNDFQGKSADEVRGRILNWLEHTADWSMVLDVPTFRCQGELSNTRGLTNFRDCLNSTLFNNNYFLKNRQHKTKFLNVLQGVDQNTADIWYDAVKHLPFEGWGFGGINMCNLDVVLRRIIKLRDDNLLNDRDWLHVLGTAQLDWSCYLTSIHREIKRTINPRFQISYDCASPFVATAYGLVYTGMSHSTRRWGIVMEKATDNKALGQNHNIAFPWESEIGRRLTIGDVCWYRPGMLNKVKKEGKTSWDSFAYALLMAHNTNIHIAAVQKANTLMDIESAKYQPDWRDWRKLKPNDRSDEMSTWVPRNILYFDQFVKELLNSETPMSMLDNAKTMISDMAGMKMMMRKAGAKGFNKFFDTEEVAVESTNNTVFSMPELDESVADEMFEKIAKGEV